MANRFLNNVTINDEYTLPNADGTADQIITTDGSGQLSFVDQNTINAGNAEHVVIYAKNTHTASIAKGTPVYITGTVGATDTVEIAPADAGNSAKMPAVGLLDATLAVNAFGYVITGGFMDNITTDPIDGTTPSSNDTVYVKVGGGLTLTKPTGPTGLIQNVAKVGKVSGGNSGSLIVSSILRTNDVPNLTTGKIWVGDGNTVESTVVHLDETNGRMGIGTNSPDTPLHVDLGTVDVKAQLDAIGGFDGMLVDGTNASYNLIGGNGDKYTLGALNDGSFRIYNEGGAGYALTLNNSGKLGIGTTDPQERLDISAGSIRLDDGLSIKWGTIDANRGRVRITGNEVNDFLQFVTDNSEKMRLTNTGLGIGTTSPSEKLEVSGKAIIRKSGSATAHADTDLLVTDATAASSTAAIEILGGNAGYSNIKFADTDSYTSGSIDYNHSSNSMTFRTNNSQNFIINSNGNVGIGTTSPSEKLHVAGNILLDNNQELRWLDSGGTQKRILELTSTDLLELEAPNRIRLNPGGSTAIDLFNGHNTKYTISSVHSFFDASANEAVRITSNGNVGIGTTNPNSILHISDANPEFILEDTTNLNRCRIKNNDGNLRFEADYNSQIGNSRHLFFIDGSEKFRINTDGNVGIGTTSPTQKLDVAGSIRTNSNLYVYNSDLSRQALRVFAEATTNTGILKLSNGSNWGLLMRGESNNPSIGSYYSGTLNITGFEDSTGTTTSAIKLAQFVFGGTGGGSGYLTLNGDLRVNTNKKIRFGYGNSQENGIEWVSGSKISAAITPVDTANYSRTGLGFFTGDFSDGTTNADERMRITRAGNVGIGTTSPGHKLQINDGNVAITGGTSSTLFMNTNTNQLYGDVNGVVILKANDNLRLHTNSAERMRITSAGDTGIGVTAPRAKLDVAGGIKVADDTDTAGANKVGTLRYRTSGNNSYVDMCMQTGASTYAWINVVQNNW